MMISLGVGSQYKVRSQRIEGWYEYRIQTLYITTGFKTGTEEFVEKTLLQHVAWKGHVT